MRYDARHVSHAAHVLSKAPWGDKCRQFPTEVLDYWEIGFVPGGTWVWPDLNEKDDSGRPIMRGWFEDRISLPWRNMEGKCVGFAGRRFDGVDHLKYKNLYGLKRNLVHCMDFISLVTT
jgi:hypothetical protein